MTPGFISTKEVQENLRCVVNNFKGSGRGELSNRKYHLKELKVPPSSPLYQAHQAAVAAAAEQVEKAKKKRSAMSAPYKSKLNHKEYQ